MFSNKLMKVPGQDASPGEKSSDDLPQVACSSQKLLGTPPDE